MKILPIAFLTLVLTGCMSDDYGLNYDCSSEGRNKVISQDNGAGQSWRKTNTSRWCNPQGGVAPDADPVFEGNK